MTTDRFEIGCWGSRLGICFPSVKLLDLQGSVQSKAEALDSSRPAPRLAGTMTKAWYRPRGAARPGAQRPSGGPSVRATRGPR